MFEPSKTEQKIDTKSPLQNAVSKLQLSSPKNTHRRGVGAGGHPEQAPAASNSTTPQHQVGSVVQKPSNQSNFQYVPVFFKKLQLVENNNAVANAVNQNE